jgi:hypothetical protein
MANKDLTDTTFGAGFLSLKLAAGTVRHSGQMALPVAVNPNSGSIMGIDGDTPFYYAGGYNAPAAYDGAGILVGSSDTAETFEDCALAAQILHGNVSGKLMYNATNPHVTSYDAGNKTLSDSLSRFFNNNSGGDITIKEVGIVSGVVIYSNWAEVYLLSRDVLVTPVLVPDSGQLKVTYTNALVYPA